MNMGQNIQPIKIFLKKFKIIRFLYRTIFRNKEGQTWASMNWKDWSTWVLSKINNYCSDAENILEIGGIGRELGDFVVGKKFSTLNFPEEDICKRTSFPAEKFDLIYSKDTFEHLYKMTT